LLSMVVIKYLQNSVRFRCKPLMLDGQQFVQMAYTFDIWSAHA
jgi:hypothetical protein